MKFIFLCLFLSISKSFALEYNDVINGVSVIKSYDNNYLVINRGLEDGIKISDHIKLTNENGYIARAICIKASMLISHWKVYRVVNPELLSFDDRYRVNSMNQSEVPEEMAEFKTADFSNEYNDISDEDMKKPVQMQQSRIANFDLPSDVKNDLALLEANKTESEQFMDRNFDSKQFAEDMQEINLSIFTSPISWQSLNDQKTINYGFNLSNSGKKYEFQLNVAKQESKQVNNYTKEEVSSESTNINMIFDINKIADGISYFMFMSYNQARNGEIYYPRRQIQGGLVGLKFHLIEDGPTITKMDFSYITLIDYLEFDLEETDEDTFETYTVIEKTRFARHSFRFRMKASLSESTTFDSTLWYKPAMNLDNQRIDWDDNLTEWTSDISWQVTEKLTVSYQYLYTYDIRQLRQYETEPMNQISTINLTYSVSL